MFKLSVWLIVYVGCVILNFYDHPDPSRNEIIVYTAKFILVACVASIVFEILDKRW